MASTAAPKVALVTACSAGLGAAIARTLGVDCGMSVVINYTHNANRANTVLASLRQETATRRRLSDAPKSAGTLYQTFHAVATNLHKLDEIARLVKETLALTGGRLDAVVSNVGWTRMTDFADLQQGTVEGDWDRCFEVNVKSHLKLFSAIHDALKAAPDGVFISTASVAGVKPSSSSLVCSAPPPSLFFFCLCCFLLLASVYILAVRRKKGGAHPSRQVSRRHRGSGRPGQLCVTRDHADGKWHAALAHDHATDNTVG
jgi:NAD(P)-dependent dehydrogenase (short-subunit alcohol dehydrogenase family)